MSRIIEVALAEIGNKEVPMHSNKTKYGQWFGLDGVAWCAIFVSWVYAHAGYRLTGLGFTNGFAGCQTGFATWKKTKELTTKPAPGDIVLFDWNADGRYDHTGIFVKDNGDGKTFTTIEGNTAIGNDSNGGIVMQRKRNYNIAVFVHPKVLDRKSL